SALYTSCLVFVFFFSSRRRHTRSKRDWSSDVCSSDLRNRAEGTVGRGMRVTTHNGYAGLGNAQLRTNGVDDALLFIAHGVQTHSEFFAVIAQRRYLGTGSLIDDFQ